jgi:hypothetical protein
LVGDDNQSKTQSRAASKSRGGYGRGLAARQARDGRRRLWLRAAPDFGNSAQPRDRIGVERSSTTLITTGEIKRTSRLTARAPAASNPRIGQSRPFIEGSRPRLELNDVWWRGSTCNGEPMPIVHPQVGDLIITVLPNPSGETSCWSGSGFVRSPPADFHLNGLDIGRQVEDGSDTIC